MLLFCLGAIMIADAGGISAQEQDSTAVKKRLVAQKKIKAPKDRVTLSIAKAKTDAEKEVSTNIVIDEDGITLDGKTFNYKDLQDSFMTSLVIEGGSIIKFGEPVVIKEDEIVDGDLLSFGGQVTVAGTVTGDVAIIGANLTLRPTGIIKGDVHTFGGSIHQEPGGQIRGQRVGVLPKDFRVIGPFPTLFRPFGDLRALGLPLFFFVIISLLFIALAGFFVPNHVERIGQAIAVTPMKSILLGFLAILLALPLFILLCVTIIGIPVALIAQPIAYFAAGVAGFAGVSFFVGTKLQRGNSMRLSSSLAKILIGALIIMAFLILAWFFSLAGRHFSPLFWLFYLIGWIIYLVASMAGVGAVILTRFGFRPALAPNSPPPVPPSSGEIENPPPAQAND
jgi:hypothetical protein